MKTTVGSFSIYICLHHLWHPHAGLPNLDPYSLVKHSPMSLLHIFLKISHILLKIFSFHEWIATSIIAWTITVQKIRSNLQPQTSLLPSLVLYTGTVFNFINRFWWSWVNMLNDCNGDVILELSPNIGYINRLFGRWLLICMFFRVCMICTKSFKIWLF